MALAQGKKRYYLTLTQSTMEEFKGLLKEFNVPSGLESVMVDEYIAGMVKYIFPVIRKAKETNQPLTVVDFFALVGNVMQASQDEQGKLL